MTSAEQTRLWRPDWPCPVGAVLGPHRRGAGDPTYRIHGATHWRALRTPDGPATLAVTPQPCDGSVDLSAWGAGADWALDQAPALLGADDDLTGFEPHHPVIMDALRHHPHWRIGRSDRVAEALVPAVIEQKVTGQEAFAGFRRLVRRWGTPAPGPIADLMLQPDPATITQIPSWEWLQLHIDPARSKPLIAVCRVASSLERLGAEGPEVLDRGLRSIPGIGIWTSAEVRSRALGDPDAVSFGDYHVAKDVGWALTGKPVDDAGMARLLEPWRGHRYRAQILIALGAGRRPRRGPRMSPRTHLPARDVHR